MVKDIEQILDDELINLLGLYNMEFSDSEDLRKVVACAVILMVNLPPSHHLKKQVWPIACILNPKPSPSLPLPFWSERDYRLIHMRNL